jgi:hypothetical protein
LLHDFQAKSVLLSNKIVKSYKLVSSINNWDSTTKSTFKTISFVSGFKSSKASVTNFLSKISVDKNNGKVEV